MYKNSREEYLLVFRESKSSQTMISASVVHENILENITIFIEINY